MSDYILTCCSTADLPESYFVERGIPYVCFTFHMDGKEYPDDLGKSIPFETFYQKISEGAMPVTSQVNVSSYESFFEPFLREGKDILHLSFSSGLSGSYQSACIARESLLERYPERRIAIVDTLAASSGYGLLVDAAYEQKKAGASLARLSSWLEQHKLELHHWFFSTDLTHLKRGGRISATSAMLGTILSICPLMNVNSEGKLIPRAKIRTKKRVIEEMVKKMEEHAKDGTNYSGKCFLCHSACLSDARKVADLVEAKFPHLNGKPEIFSIGTVIGSHTGPGTVALFFWGDQRIDE